MSGQKALLYTEEGNWYVGLRRKPVPYRGHVLVKIHATSLNPMDCKIGRMDLLKQYPAVLGSDAAGTIEEVGDDVAQWRKGDRV